MTWPSLAYALQLVPQYTTGSMTSVRSVGDPARLTGSRSHLSGPTEKPQRSVLNVTPIDIEGAIDGCHGHAQLKEAVQNLERVNSSHGPSSSCT